MQQFIYKLTPIRPEMLEEGPTEKESETLNSHLAYLTGLKDEGVVKLAGRTTKTDSSVFGLVILLAKDEEVARQVMADDPAVKEGVMAAKIFPFRIALMGDPV